MVSGFIGIRESIGGKADLPFSTFATNELMSNTKNEYFDGDVTASKWLVLVISSSQSQRHCNCNEDSKHMKSRA